MNSMKDIIRTILIWVWEMACLSCWRGWRASVGSWVACLRGWRASVCSVDGVSGVLTWVACYYYCYCYYWNTTLKKKMLSVNVKSEKMFQIDLNSDLKKEPHLKCRYSLYITLNRSQSQRGQICLKMWNFVNMPEHTWNITCLNKLGL